MLSLVGLPNRPIYHEVGIGPTYQSYADIAIDSRTPEPSIPQVDPPVHHEIGTNTASQLYADAAIASRTPEPMADTETVRRVFKDAANDPQTPQHPTPLRRISVGGVYIGSGRNLVC